MAGNAEINQFENNEFYFNLANNTVPNCDPKIVFGRNLDIDTGTVPEDVWAPGGVWVPPPSAAVASIVSDSADDASAGIGAQTLQIEGLDANLVEQVETITMNGVTPVLTANTYLRINKMVAVTAGSSGSNVGTITITQGTIQGQMDPGIGSTLSARYSVPSNKRALIVSVVASATRPGAPGGAMAQFVITRQGIAAGSAKVYLFGQGLAIESSLNGQLKIPFNMDPSTDIVFTITSVTDLNTIVEAGMSFALCDT